MRTPINQSVETIAVFKVTESGMFDVELWNGDPIPADLAEDIRNAGFTPLAGGGTSFMYNGENVEDGVLLLSAMQVMHLA